MSYLHARVLDRGLETLVRDTTHLLISTNEPLDYAAALANMLGGVIPSIIGPSNYLPVGRKVIVLEVTHGWVDTNGSAAFWSLVDDRGQHLLASGSLLNPLAVEAGNAFTLTAFEIAIPGAVAGTGTPPIIIHGETPPTYRSLVSMG